MRRPIFVRPISDAERESLEAGLRSSDAFVLRRCQILLASSREMDIGSAPPPFALQNVTDDWHPYGVLMIPRSEPEIEENATFSPALALRSTSEQEVEYKPPPVDVQGTLQFIGLKSVEHAENTREPTSRAGVFSQMDALGVTAAVFGDEEHEADAQNELGEQYEFVPNFPLSLPAREESGGERVTPDDAAQISGTWPAESGVAQAHDLNIFGAGVLVGVLDSGIDADHREFSHQAVTYRYVPFPPPPGAPQRPARDVRGFDTDNHGTHVSGIIAGASVGIVPKANLYVASVLESETLPNPSCPLSR